MMADYSKGYTVAEDRALDELKEVIVKIAKVRQQILKSKKEMENCKLVVKYNDEKYFELRCLLDTRSNDDGSKTGYQLFVSSHNDERNVYVIPRADVMGIKKLTNPAEAIDHYAAHLFSRAEGEFDFMQYAEDF